MASLSEDRDDPARIFIVDDDPSVRVALEASLRALGEPYRVTSFTNGKEALSEFEASPPDCVLLDIRMPGQSGLEVLPQMVAADPSVPVVMVTGEQDIRSAVEAMRRGAYDYLPKPVSADRVIRAVSRAIEHGRLHAELRHLRGELQRVYGFDSIVGRHPRMLAVYETIGRVAGHRSSVLVTGESGTGKEIVARAIHHSSGLPGPFVAVNCAAVPESLFEAEFFGHAKGAFTGAHADRLGYLASANRGSLFLDEIGELPVASQAKLLRALQERVVTPVGSTRPINVDFRLICATNRDLEAEVEQGRFRQDLFFRVSVIPIEMPALRDRRSDIPLLVSAFLHQLSRTMDVRLKSVSEEVMSLLQTYPWPGNVRELQNVIERAVALSRGTVIESDVLPDPVRATRPGPATALAAVFAGRLTLPEAIEIVEREALEEALRRSDGNKSAAASMLGISRRRFNYRLGQLLEKDAAGETTDDD